MSVCPIPTLIEHVILVSLVSYRGQPFGFVVLSRDMMRSQYFNLTEILVLHDNKMSEISLQWLYFDRKFFSQTLPVFLDAQLLMDVLQEI